MNLRKLLPVVIYLALLCQLVFVVVQPIHSLRYNLLMLGLSGLLLAWSAYLVRRRRWALGILAVLLALPLLTLLNWRALDPVELRARYLDQLASFAGTDYVWGGENRCGIDCSGLPRKSLINALAGYGLMHANGRALVHACTLWWYDASALELLGGYGGETLAETPVYRINQLNEAARPGDLAVTKGGAHVMVYLDAHTIIQAEPGRGSVVIDTIPATNHWFDEPVRLVHWQVLQ